MKIIAFYLPQFHEIPENNKWWGKGFTEWTNVKKAEPLFGEHYQPRIPMNNNYYDLSDGTKTQRWQCKIAREHGIYGFCFYHYWFDGHLLLEKPVEAYLKDEKCDLPFCISWANENWTKAWVSKEDNILISQTYGNKDEWIRHFNYLLPFIRDERYITIDGSPLIILYRPELIGNKIDAMLDCWNELAKENGLQRPIYAYQHPRSDDFLGDHKKNFRFAIEYQPHYTLLQNANKFSTLRKLKLRISNFTEKHFGIQINVKNIAGRLGNHNQLEKFDYDAVWEKLLHQSAGENRIPGVFVDWDNTPRRGCKGRLFLGGSADKFEKYMERAIIKAKNEYDKDMMFIFAWNEWTEGGILEPTEKDGYGYLNAIKEALENTGEWPWK